MDGMFSLAEPSLIALFLALGMAASWIIGQWLGSREPSSVVEPAESRLNDASLTLLALLLAFAFGTSMARHEQRRLMVIADANAIGDFYTCASLLSEPLRTQLQTEIREYARLRLETARQGLKPLDLDRALYRFRQMQQEMTALVAQAVSSGTPIAHQHAERGDQRTWCTNRSRRGPAANRHPSPVDYLRSNLGLSRRPRGRKEQKHGHRRNSQLYSDRYACRLCHLRSG
jgi:hypothetical protein